MRAGRGAARHARRRQTRHRRERGGEAAPSAARRTSDGATSGRRARGSRLNAKPFGAERLAGVGERSRQRSAVGRRRKDRSDGDGAGSACRVRLGDRRASSGAFAASRLRRLVRGRLRCAGRRRRAAGGDPLRVGLDRRRRARLLAAAAPPARACSTMCRRTPAHEERSPPPAAARWRPYAPRAPEDGERGHEQAQQLRHVALVQQELGARVHATPAHGVLAARSPARRELLIPVLVSPPVSCAYIGAPPRAHARWAWRRAVRHFCRLARSVVSDSTTGPIDRARVELARADHPPRRRSASSSSSWASKARQRCNRLRAGRRRGTLPACRAATWRSRSASAARRRGPGRQRRAGARRARPSAALSIESARAHVKLHGADAPRQRSSRRPAAVAGHDGEGRARGEQGLPAVAVDAAPRHDNRLPSLPTLRPAPSRRCSGLHQATGRLIAEQRRGVLTARARAQPAPPPPPSPSSPPRAPRGAQTRRRRCGRLSGEEAAPRARWTRGRRRPRSARDCRAGACRPVFRSVSVGVCLRLAGGRMGPCGTAVRAR